MIYRVAAGGVVAAHLGYIAFLLGGGFLARRWPRLLWVHASTVVVTSIIFLGNFDCPLTDLETQLRRLAGQAAYEGGFVAHYLVEPVGTNGFTRTVHTVMPGLLLALNAVAYRRALRPASAG